MSVSDQDAATRDFDVIVVGSGMAGLSAAVEAAADGAEVLLVEAATALGASAPSSTGIMMAAGTSLQRANGFEDTPDALFHDYMLANHWDVVPSVVRRLVDELRTPSSGSVTSGSRPGSADLRGERARGGAIRCRAGTGDRRRSDPPRPEAAEHRHRPEPPGRPARRRGGVVRGIAAGDQVVRAGAVVLAMGGFGGESGPVREVSAARS